MDKTDAQLAGLYLSTRAEVHLEALVRRNLPLVLSYLKTLTGNSDTAADIAQETFVKVWKNLKHYDQRKSFRTWLFTIAKRTAIDELRKRHALPFSALAGEDGADFAETLADDQLSPFQLADGAYTRNLVAVAIGTLPAGHASIVRMRMNEDMTFSHIARQTGSPLNTVKSTYRRALSALGHLLSDH